MSNPQDCESLIQLQYPIFSNQRHTTVAATCTLSMHLPRTLIQRHVSPPPPLPTKWSRPQADPGAYSFINNEFVKGQDGKTFESINPSTEKPICEVQEATEKDVDHAVSVARKAFETTWKNVTPEQRGKYLVKLADLFEQNLELLASIESLDNGKALSMAKVDIGMCAGCLRYYGGWADKIHGKVIETVPETFNYTKQEPVCPPGSTFERVRS